MGKALKAVGTAIVVVGLAVATGGASVALGAGVGAFGSVGLGWSATSLAVGGFSITASGLVQTGMMLSSLGAGLSRPKTAATASAGQWTMAPIQPIPFAFGEIAVAGKIIHRDEFGPDDMYQSIVSIVDGGGPISQFLGFQADDQAVTFDLNGKAISSEYANEMWINYRMGAQPDTALSPPSGLKAGGQPLKWSSSHSLPGCAAYMLTLAENSKHTAYPSGEPKVLQRLRGERLWDPRQDGTWPGGVGACRLNDPDTWVYSANGALHALKWSLGIWWDGTGEGAPGVGLHVGGLGVSLAGIDVAALVNAANVADANGWTCGAWPNSAEDKHQVLRWFLQAAGAVYAEDCGRISCITRGEVGTSIVTITARDTAGPVELDAGKPRLERINTLTPTFWSPAHRWEMTPLDPISVPEYVAEDGGVQRGEGADYPYVTAPDQAAQLCAYDIVDSREGISGVLPLKPYLKRLRPGQCATINEPGFLLSGQKIKVWKRSYDPGSAIVRLTVTSETDAKHAFAQGETGTAPPTPSLTAMPAVSPPGAGDWTASAGLVDTDSPVIEVTGACENLSATAVVFELREDGATDWTLVGTEAPTVERRTITGLTRDTAYDVAVSYRQGERGSSRLILGPVSVGDTTPPGPVTEYSVTGALGGIDIKWANPTDADFALVRLYRHTSDSVGSAAYVGEIRGTAWRDVPPAMGVDYWYWAATVDRSGNEGVKTLLGSGQATRFGDLVTRDGLDWDDIGDRPDVLTDGRLEAAIAPDGTLTNGATSGSNLVTRAGGGGVFTGDLNAQVNPADLAALDPAAASDLTAAKSATDSLGALASKDEAGTDDLAPNSASDRVVSTVSGSPSIKSASSVELATATVTLTDSSQQVEVSIAGYLSLIGAAGGTRGDVVAPAYIEVSRDGYGPLIIQLQLGPVKRDWTETPNLSHARFDAPGAPGTYTYRLKGQVANLANVQSATVNAGVLTLNHLKR